MKSVLFKMGWNLLRDKFKSVHSPEGQKKKKKKKSILRMRIPIH